MFNQGPSLTRTTACTTRRPAIELVAAALIFTTLACASSRPRVLTIGDASCPVYVEPAVRTVARDTLWWTARKDEQICRSPDDPSKWIAQITWLQQDDVPERILRFAAVPRLESLGIVTDSTRFNLIRHEFLVVGADTSDALRRMRDAYPSQPPKGLVRMMRRLRD